MSGPPALIQAEAVSRRFVLPRGQVLQAVDGATIEIARGEALGLVGESGCGKSTLGRMLAGILPPTKGRVTLEGRPVMTLGLRARKLDPRVQMVFQDPFSSLNPRMRIGHAIAEGPVAHGLVSRIEAHAYACDWLRRVGLDPAHAERHPHQFSGGQRQRIAIARALAMRPEVLVCDEPVASLDVSIQAQIVNLFANLRAELSLTLLFISHDLGIVRHLCDRIAVMYLGRIVETGAAAELVRSPRHPYTRALLESVPRLMLDGSRGEFRAIAGEIPSPLSPPTGCHFRTRCPRAAPVCGQQRPPLAKFEAGAAAACHFPEEKRHA